MTFTSDFWRLVASRERTNMPIFMRQTAAAAVVIYTEREQNLMMADGDPEVASHFIAEALEQDVALDRTMMSYSLFEGLPESLLHRVAPHWGFEWDLYYADRPLPPVPGADKVELIERTSAEFSELRGQIVAALRSSNPITSALNEVDELDWFILREDDGNIATVMGANFGDDLVHFAGLGTVPNARGRGFGGATMVGAVNISLSRVPLVQFGVWSWNTGALRLYDRLGLTRAGRVISGREEPFPDLARHA